MITNEAGLDIIKEFEGWSATPYLDPVGIPTIGWGSIWDFDGSRMTMDHAPIDEGYGEGLLSQHLRHVERCVARLIRVPITENEFSALCSFTYNVGSGNLQASTLRRKLNRGERLGAANEFPKWRRARGRILAGLVRRRRMEARLFLTAAP